MSVKVRLTRTGANRDLSFRVVAADTRFPRDGRFIENLGWYDPAKPGVNYGLKEDRIAYWKSVGAILSPVVKSLLQRSKRTAAGKPEHTHQKISKGKKAKLAKAAKAAAN
jgi:small subunit ribosomal protein S16